MTDITGYHILKIRNYVGLVFRGKSSKKIGLKSYKAQWNCARGDLLYPGSNIVSETGSRLLDEHPSAECDFTR